MANIQDAVRQWKRNGRWGTCVDCPRLNGEAFPEQCRYSSRCDHQLTFDELASQCKCAGIESPSPESRLCSSGRRERLAEVDTWLAKHKAVLMRNVMVPQIGPMQEYHVDGRSFRIQVYEPTAGNVQGWGAWIPIPSAGPAETLKALSRHCGVQQSPE